MSSESVVVHRAGILAGSGSAGGRRWLAALTYLALSAGALVMILPFVWMVSTSLKTSAAVFVYPPEWLPDPLIWTNYAEVVRIMPFLRYVLNTAGVAGS